MRVELYFTLFFAAILYALYKGGAPERVAATTALSMWVFDKFLHFVTPPEYATMDLGHFIIDLIVWVGFLSVALCAKRFWPLWVVSLQTIALAGHVAKLMDVSIHQIVSL